MPRVTKPRTRKSHAATRSHAVAAVNRVLMRRYLAFVRAVVSASTKTATR